MIMNDIINKASLERIEKGINMEFNKSIYRYADDLIEDYAKYDKFTEQFELDVSTINEIELRHFVALILETEPSYAAEAIGPDNSMFETKMVPSLVELLRIDDLKAIVQFRNNWHTSLLKYFAQTMQRIINKKLETYNDAKKEKNY
jgi:hypothetical protein